MTRADIDLRLKTVCDEIRLKQEDAYRTADEAVYAEAAYKKKLLESLIKPDTMKLKSADEREAYASQLAADEWLKWKLATNAARNFKEKVDQLQSELSSVQTQARLLISEMEFERRNWEP